MLSLLLESARSETLLQIIDSHYSALSPIDNNCDPKFPHAWQAIVQ